MDLAYAVNHMGKSLGIFVFNSKAIFKIFRINYWEKTIPVYKLLNILFKRVL